jgi:hypothetical protein
VTRDTGRQIFEDLLTLEISVVIKPGMTARKMPEPPHALLDSIGDYDGYLRPMAVQLNKAWGERGQPEIQVRPPSTGPAPIPNHRLTDSDGMLRKKPDAPFLPVDSVNDAVDVKTFDILRERAVAFEAVYRYAVAHGWRDDDGSGVILKRIYRNCDQIKEILRRRNILDNGFDRFNPQIPDLKLDQGELLTVRKMWEVGVEAIVMQSSAQLDGDIITKIQEARQLTLSQPVHDLHREAMESSLKHWEFLIQTAIQFMSSAVQSFFLL